MGLYHLAEIRWSGCGSHLVVTLIAGSKRRSLLMAGDDDEMFDKKSQCYAEDNRTVHLIQRSDKSVAYITNKKRLCSMFCTIEAKY